MTQTSQRLRKFSLLALGGAALALAPLISQPTDARVLGFPGTNETPASFADLIDAVMPAVVAIKTRSVTNSSDMLAGVPQGMQDLLPQMGTQQQITEGEGSGFFISADGQIVTNYHVIAGATEIEVTMFDGTVYEAEIIGTDEETDLAVIKVDADKSFDYVKWREKAPLRRGDWVVAIGNPYGFEFTATTGIISATGRDIPEETYVDFIQIDAPINQGNSGGPLFDLEGRVIGINSSIYSPSGGNVGIAFAIPSDYAQKIVQHLRTDGRVPRGWLGATIRTADMDIAKAVGMETVSGAIIEFVTPNSPAAQAGLQSSDIIVSIDDQVMETSKQVVRRIGNVVAGESIKVTVNRNGEYEDFRVKIAARPDAEKLAAYNAGTEMPSSGTVIAPDNQVASANGMTLQVMTSSMRNRYGLRGSEEGVWIENVESGSKAASKGLRPGMVILEVGGNPVSAPSDVSAAIEQARNMGREAVLVKVLTAQGRFTIGLPI